MSIGLQAMPPSPCHAGLAEPRCMRLVPCPALSAGSCPLALSGSGKPLTQGSPLNPSHLRWGCCMNYCGAPDAGGSQVQRFVRHGGLTQTLRCPPPMEPGVSHHLGATPMTWRPLHPALPLRHNDIMMP